MYAEKSENSTLAYSHEFHERVEVCNKALHVGDENSIEFINLWFRMKISRGENEEIENAVDGNRRNA